VLKISEMASEESGAVLKDPGLPSEESVQC
jgi:hypothetical protein